MLFIIIVLSGPLQHSQVSEGTDGRPLNSVAQRGGGLITRARSAHALELGQLLLDLAIIAQPFKKDVALTRENSRRAYNSDDIPERSRLA